MLHLNFQSQRKNFKQIMSSRTSGWIRLPDPPKSLRYGVSSNWHHDSFVIAPDWKTSQSNGVYRYNAITGKWDIVIKYPINKNFWVRDIATDPKNDNLFIWTNVRNDYVMGEGCLEDCYLLTGNAKSKQSRGVFKNQNGRVMSHSHSIVYIKEQLHFFDENSHGIWNGKSGDGASFEMVSKYTWRRMCGFFESRFIALPSKGIILLIGGRCATWQYDFEILKYSVESKQWSGTGIEFKYWRPTVVLTPSEKYVILAGGKRFGDQQYGENIHILDIQDDANWNLYESKVTIPKDVEHHLAVTGGVENDHLVIGWTRALFKKQEYLKLCFPPLYLLQIIGKWLWCEELHWIRSKNTKAKESHLAIDLKYVLGH